MRFVRPVVAYRSGGGSLRRGGTGLSGGQPPRHPIWHRLGCGPRAAAAAGAPAGGRDPRTQRLEAILFLAREPLSSRKLSQYANLADATEARTLVRRLNHLYDENGRAFRVEEVAGGFQLLTRPHFAPWLRRLQHLPAETRLTAPALETLAVVAYRQPIPRAEIEAVRGVSCGEILRQLMERDLVRIAGRSEELGRPYLYGTTKHFLRVFGLKNLELLPRVRQMREAIQEDKPADEHDVSPRASGGKMEEDSDVTVITATTKPSGEDLERPNRNVVVSEPKGIDDDAEFEDDDDFDDDDDEYEDDFDDEDDDDDDEFDDFDDDDDDDDEELDDFEEEDDWEEVDDEDDEDWEDEDDDDWDDEDEDEEEDEDW